ncbi:MAG: type VI secretion system protein TssA [Moraxellaceae bacterium]|nr:MAG: type VI secretion system protein TssA [Moraxellaceae bacterium]
MASPAIIDIESLLIPISEETPAGSDIREDRSANSLFYQIKDARERARTAERNAMLENDDAANAQEEWREVLNVAPKILTEVSKDIEVAAWYIEALVRVHGYAGFRDGLLLAQKLAENFWDNVFPIPDEDDDEDVRETRCASYAGLNGEGREGTIIPPIRNIEITEDREMDPLAYWQYLQAMEIQKVADEEVREERIAAAGISIDLFQRAMDSCSVEFCQNLIADIEGCLEAFQQLTTTLDEKGGEFSPPSSNIKNILTEILGVIKHLTKDKLALAAPAEGEEGEAGSEGESAATGGATQGAGVAAGAIQNREEAFKQILRIADFFMKTEPHSPVPYALEKAVRWGRMPLHSLMGELLTDSGARDTYELVTGVKLNEED